MLNSKYLLDILLPHTIREFGNETIHLIQAKGKASGQELNKFTNSAYISDNKISYMSKRIKEMAQTKRTNGLNDTEKILFCSEVKFNDSEKIIDLINENEITIEQLNVVNELIMECQKAYLLNTIPLVQIESRYNLKVEQAKQIIALKTTLLNTNYKLNDADTKTYETAKKMLTIIKLYETKIRKTLFELNANATVQKLLSINKNNFGFYESDFYLLMNKINELLVICPEKLKTKETQKKLK